MATLTHTYKRSLALIAFIKTRVDSRDEILPLFERLRAACGEAIHDDAADTERVGSPPG